MRYKYFFLIGNESFQVNPLGTSKLQKSIAEAGSGKNFYETKLKGKITFTGSEFNILKNIELSDNRCQEVIFVIEKLCGTTYIEDARGLIKMNSGDWNLDLCKVEIEVLPIDEYHFYEIFKDEEVNILSVLPSKINVAYNSGSQFDNCRSLNLVLDYFARELCGYNSVSSDFFQINPLELATNTNYVTGQESTVNNIMISQKSDIRRPGNSDATILKITFDKLLKLLTTVYNVMWWIDSDNILRIEHISRKTQDVGLNLLTDEFKDYLKGSNSYSYDVDEMPKYEDFKFMEAGSVDFIGRSIIYDSICVTEKGDNARKVYQADELTTDVDFLLDNPSNDIVSDAGLVFLSCKKELNGSFTLRKDLGVISGLAKNNVAFGWANLHRDFFKHGRVLRRGYMNSIITDFDEFTIGLSKKQKKISIPFCCSVLDTYKLVATSLGDGRVSTADFNYKTQILEIELKYPGDKGLIETFAPMAEHFLASGLQGSTIIVDFIDHVTDEDGFIVWSTLKIYNAPRFGMLTINGSSISYLPNVGFFGVETLYWGVEDNNGKISNMASLKITVQQIPVAKSDRFTTVKDTLFQSFVSVLANDTSQNPLLASLMQPATDQGGEVSLLNTGFFTFTPSLLFVGQDRFAYKATENITGLESTAYVLLDVLNSKTSAVIDFGPEIENTNWNNAPIFLRTRKRAIYVKFPVDVYNVKVEINVLVTNSDPTQYPYEEVISYLVTAVANQNTLLNDSMMMIDEIYSNVPRFEYPNETSNGNTATYTYTLKSTLIYNS
jgi:hypothetical protein